MLSTHRQRELRRGEGREEESGMGMGKMNCQLLKITREGWKRAGLLYFFLMQRLLCQ